MNTTQGSPLSLKGKLIAGGLALAFIIVFTVVVGSSTINPHDGLYKPVEYRGGHPISLYISGSSWKTEYVDGSGGWHDIVERSEANGMTIWSSKAADKIRGHVMVYDLRFRVHDDHLTTYNADGSEDWRFYRVK